MPEANKETIAEKLGELRRQLNSKRPDLAAIYRQVKRISRASLRGALAIDYDAVYSTYIRLAEQDADKRKIAIRKQIERFQSMLGEETLPDEDLAGQLHRAIQDLKELGLPIPETRKWEKDIEQLAEEASELGRFLEIKNKVEDLWKSAQASEANRGAPLSIVGDYKTANDEVQGALKSRSISATNTRRSLQNLGEKARVLLRDAQERHEVPTTRATGEEMVTQLRVWIGEEESEKKKDLKQQKVINFFDSAEPNAKPKLMTISDAIPIARERLVRFWANKVAEYNAEAQKFLDQSDPAGASQVLRKCDELPGLGDSVINEKLADDSKRIVDNLRVDVQDAQRKYDTAQGIGNDALMALGRADYAEAIRLVQQAATVYKSSNVASVKKQIQSQMLNDARARLKNAETWLDEGLLEQAGDAVLGASGLLGIASIPSSKYLKGRAEAISLVALGENLDVGDLEAQVRQVAETLRNIETIQTQVQELTDPHQAKDKLDSFIRQYSKPRVDNWTPIRQLYLQVVSKVDARNDITDLRKRVRDNATLSDLNRCLDDYKGIVARAPEEYTKELQVLKEEIDARIGYSNAKELECNYPSEARKSLEPALSFKPANLTDELREFKKLVEKLGAELKGKIASGKEIAGFLQKLPEEIAKNPQVAREDANKFRGLSDDLDTAIDTAFQDWEIKTLQTIDDCLSRDLTLQNIFKIDDLLDKLGQINEEKKKEYRDRFPFAKVRAELLEQKASLDSNTIADWDKIAEAWEKTTKAWEDAVRVWEIISPDTSDASKDLGKTLNERVAQARKHGTLARNRGTLEKLMNASPEKQINDLSCLRSTDAKILLQLTKAHLKIVERAYSGPNSTRANEKTLLEYSTEALEYAESGLESFNAAEYQTELIRARARAQVFKRVEEQMDLTAHLLGDSQIGIANCKKAKEAYESAQREIIRAGAGFETALMARWIKIVSEVRAKLREQSGNLPPTGSLSDQIRPWVCLLILADDPASDAESLARVSRLGDIVRDLEERVDSQINFDVMQWSKNSNASSENVIREQVNQVRELRKEFREPDEALQSCQQFLPSGPDLQRQLFRCRERLDAWQKRLEQFQRKTGEVREQADAGLRRGEFGLVKKALGIETGNTDSAFAGFYNHPTYIWLNEYVDQQEKRHDDQKTRRQRIEWAFEYEHVVTVEQFDAVAREWQIKGMNAPRELKDAYTAFVQSLRVQFLAVPKRFLIESVLAEMQAMKKKEPADATGLQASLQYRDPMPDKSDPEVLGLEAIIARFQTKIDQIEQTEAWLKSLLNYSRGDRWEEKIESVQQQWRVQIKAIERARDACQLDQALKMRELTQVDVAQKLTTIENPPDVLREPKSHVMHSFNQISATYIKSLQNQKKELIEMGADIQARITKQKDAWELVLEMAGRWGDANRSRLPFKEARVHKAREELRQACANYFKICPCDPKFHEVLNDAGLTDEFRYDCQ